MFARARRETVDDEPRTALVLDESGFAENTQMAGDRGLRKSKREDHLGHGLFALCQRVQERQSGRIAQRAKDARPRDGMPWCGAYHVVGVRSAEIDTVAPRW